MSTPTIAERSSTRRGRRLGVRATHVLVLVAEGKLTAEIRSMNGVASVPVAVEVG